MTEFKDMRFDHKYPAILGSYFLSDFADHAKKEILRALAGAQPREWRTIWEETVVRFSDPNFALEFAWTKDVNPNA